MCSLAAAGLLVLRGTDRGMLGCGHSEGTLERRGGIFHRVRSNHTFILQVHVTCAVNLVLQNAPIPTVQYLPFIKDSNRTHTQTGQC